jgi:hypothetical protein
MELGASRDGPLRRKRRGEGIYELGAAIPVFHPHTRGTAGQRPQVFPLTGFLLSQAGGTKRSPRRPCSWLQQSGMARQSAAWVRFVLPSWVRFVFFTLGSVRSARVGFGSFCQDGLRSCIRASLPVPQCVSHPGGRVTPIHNVKQRSLRFFVPAAHRAPGLILFSSAPDEGAQERI